MHHLFKAKQCNTMSIVTASFQSACSTVDSFMPKVKVERQKFCVICRSRPNELCSVAVYVMYSLFIDGHSSVRDFNYNRVSH